jgi:signal transduction histidine kinase
LLLLTLSELAQIFEVVSAAVILIEGGHLRIAGEAPPRVGTSSEMPLASTPLAHSVLAERQAAVTQIDAHSADTLLAILRERGVQQALIAPLVAQDHAIGLVVLGDSRYDRSFLAEDRALLRVLSGLLAPTISALQLHESAARRSYELATLNEIATTVTSTLDMHEVYRLVVQKLSAYFNVEAGSLLLRDELTNELVFVMTIEGGEEKLAGVRVPSGAGVVGAVLQRRQWEIVDDVRADPRFYAKVSEDAGFVTRSILCVPMITKGRAIGVIELLNKVDGRFTADEAERLLRMAAFIAVAIENARLFQQVSDTRDRLALILDAAADGIILSDTADIIQTANPTAALLLNSSVAGLVGTPRWQALEALVRRALGEPHEIAASNGELTLGIRDWALSGGEQRFLREIVLPVRDETGTAYGQLTLLRDMTQERELERLRDDYTNMLVHDLRAPLSAIINGIQMLQRGLGGPLAPPQHELLQIAYQSSQAMLRLINNLLDISKLEQGSLTLDKQPLDPRALIDSVVARLQGSIRSQQVAVVTEIAADLPTVEGDEDKIVRVIQNLLDNAIKFSPSSSQVIVGAYAAAAPPPERHERAETHEGVVFFVQDHGSGIPAAFHDRIFEKFGQVSGHRVHGTGLGLAFCRLAIEAHGGRIWVDSREGVGSTFAFVLPLSEHSNHA